MRVNWVQSWRETKGLHPLMREYHVSILPKKIIKPTTPNISYNRGSAPFTKPKPKLAL